MNLTSNFLQKQSSFLLENPRITWCVIGGFSVLPITAWIALAIMSLITLRNGLVEGFKCLIIALTVSICIAELQGIAQFDNWSIVLSSASVNAVLCYMLACILGVWSSWQVVAAAALSIAVLINTSFHVFAPNLIEQQYYILLNLLKTFDQGQVVAQLIHAQNANGILKLAYYLFGIKLLSIVISAITPILFARYVQSILFYIGEFKKEMLAFRANRLILMLLILSILGAHQDNLLSISCLPMFFVYLMIAGVSLILDFLAKKLVANKSKAVAYTILFVPTIIIPYIILPLYVAFGSLDSLFNLRSRWNVIDCKNK